MTWLRIFSFLTIMASSGAAHAVSASGESADIVARQMLRCLKLPENAPASFSIAAVIVLKDGAADTVSVNFRNHPSAWEQAAAPLLADAITECEPYNTISERIELSVTPELINAGSKN